MTQSAVYSIVVYSVAVFALIAAVIYTRIYRHAVATGGKVRTDAIAFPDLMAVIFLYTWLLRVAALGFAPHQPRALGTHELLQGGLSFALIVFLIFGFLAIRKISIARFIGLRSKGIGSILLHAVPLLIAAVPMVSLAMIAMSQSGLQARPQETVEFFRESARHSDQNAILATMALGVIVAPLAEEFIFRGFIYTVLKRYIGIFGAMILNAGLFAALHMNVSALPGLFILAVCFTLAYEATGSLLVNVCMHAMFNLTAFLFMLYIPGAPS